VVHWRKKCDGIGTEATFDQIVEILHFQTKFPVELSKSDKTIKLNIPHGELFHACTDTEWREILEMLNEPDKS
jgi:hypothetical protein